MINGSTLKTTNERVRIADPNASMQGLKDDMEFFNRGEKYRLPIEIVLDTAKFGGLFNSSTQDCLIIRNKEHLDDYFQHCVVCTRTGRTSTLELSTSVEVSSLAKPIKRKKERVVFEECL